MKTFKQFQESAYAIPAIKGASKYALPLLMTGIGAAGTIFQARKKRKIPRGEQRLRDRENNVRDNDMIRAKEGEIEKQNKMIDNYEIIKQELQKRLDKGAEGKFRRGHSGKFQQSDADLKNKIKEIGKKIKDKKNLQDSYVSEEGAMAVPTNNVGGGMIAGTVEAGDDPPKKKRNCKTYAYGGVGSRKMWMPKKA